MIKSDALESPVLCKLTSESSRYSKKSQSAGALSGETRSKSEKAAEATSCKLVDMPRAVGNSKVAKLFASLGANAETLCIVLNVK